jgi:hypothetical protein
MYHATLVAAGWAIAGQRSDHNGDNTTRNPRLPPASFGLYFPRLEQRTYHSKWLNAPPRRTRKSSDFKSSRCSLPSSSTG